MSGSLRLELLLAQTKRRVCDRLNRRPHRAWTFIKPPPSPSKPTSPPGPPPHPSPHSQSCKATLGTLKGAILIYYFLKVVSAILGRNIYYYINLIFPDPLAVRPVSRLSKTRVSVGQPVLRGRTQ